MQTGSRHKRGFSATDANRLPAKALHEPGARSANLDLVFSALSNPTRRAILARLSRGESTVSELAEPFDMSLPAVSKHLRILEDARVITVTKDGRTHRCALAPAPLKDAGRWMAFYEHLWEGQLESLSKFLKSSRGASA